MNRTAVYAVMMLAAVVATSVSLASFAGPSHAVIVSNPPGSSVPGCEETDGGCFRPNPVTVARGGVVTWANDDAAAHTVTSGILAEGGPDGIFDSGLMSPGGAFSYRFDVPGVYPYFCLVHPWMEGTVTAR